MSFGITELVIILVIVVLLFGTTKLKSLGTDLGSAIKGFRSVTFKEGAEDFVVDKDPGLEHWIDGCGYLILSAMNQVKPWVTGPAKSRKAQVW